MIIFLFGKEGEQEKARVYLNVLGGKQFASLRMSVENQSGKQEIAGKQEGTQRPSNMHSQFSDSFETMEKLPSSTSTSSVPIIANFIEKESSLTGKNAARDWMENMDGIERTCALAFVDKTFWAAFLSFASWSKSPSTTSGGNGKYSHSLSTIRRVVPSSARRSAIPGTLNDEDSIRLWRKATDEISTRRF